MSEDKTQAVLLPGRTIEILDGNSKVIVYPMGVVQIKKFSDSIKQFVDAAAEIKVQHALAGQINIAIFAAVAPLVIEHLSDLVFDCCSFQVGAEIDKIPHWEIPCIVEAWIDENFDEPKKWMPWVKMIDKAVSKATKEEFSLLETLSASSSIADTQE